MAELNKIECPHCGENFQVEAALAKHLEADFAKKLQEEKVALNKKLKEEKDVLEKERATFADKVKNQNAIFKTKMDAAVAKKEVELKKNISEEFSQKISAQEKELEEKRKKVLELKDKEIEIERIKTQMQEQEKDLQLKFEKNMRTEIASKEEALGKRISEQFELRFKEKEKQLEDQKKLIEEMKRKAEQGSMQTQGEVQELAIEEYLQSMFPLDSIEEIKKGARGGDCIQTVNTRVSTNCGTIYYESKRTKDFQPSWLDKFKADITQRGADIGVIVTQAMPKDMDRMGEKNGIWICSYAEFKGLSHVLRSSIIKIHEASSKEENKGEKMGMLYSYLTSNEFKLHMENIVEGFTQMQTDLQKEKNAMSRIWNQREKQIQKVLLSTTGMYGSIKGIAGNAIPDMAALELGGGDDLSIDTDR
jgi:hypothetical protein